jgi:two-component SAPR family response regulator
MRPARSIAVKLVAIISNDDFQSKLVRALFESLGHMVLESSTLHGGIAILENFAVHILFCDTSLSEGIWLDLIRKVRENNISPENDHTIIVLLSETDEYFIRYREIYNIETWLHKPVKIADAEQILISLL